MFRSTIIALLALAASSTTLAAPVRWLPRAEESNVTVSDANWPSGFPRAAQLIDDPSAARRQGVQDRAVNAPRFVIYSDAWVTGGKPPMTSSIPGWNVFALSFWWPNGPQDMAQGWQQLSAGERSTVLTEYHNAGIALIVAAYGSVPTPTSSGNNPTTDAQSLANWVRTYGLDGADLDYEDFDAFNKGTAEQWIVTFTRAYRAASPSSIFTHAPVAPWFTDSGRYAIPGSSVGGYLWINQQVGSLIDFYNVQFYNQDDYTTCDSLLNRASNPLWIHSSVFEIAARGVDLNKIVIGKPASPADANNGYVEPSLLAQCVKDARSRGWNAGLMLWQYPHQPSNFIQQVWGGTVTPPPPPPPGGNCGGVSAWNSGTAYVGGSKVTYNGHLWTAKWWTQNEVPGGASGVWTDTATC